MSVLKRPNQLEAKLARSAQMARIRSKNTKPELIVRQIIDEIGVKYKIHGPGLPGQPDFVFARRKKIIFVHGCFWHQHNSEKCWRSRIPKTRREFWIPKLDDNLKRDRRQIAQLRKIGWTVLVIWECQTTPTKRPQLKNRIEKFLMADSTKNSGRISPRDQRVM